jgi:hypothetical protein
MTTPQSNWSIKLGYEQRTGLLCDFSDISGQGHRL